MAKKSKSKSKFSILYCVGTLLAVIGFCLPVFTTKLFGMNSTGLSFINFDKFGTTVSIGALLIFAGVCAGLLLAVLNFLKIKIPSLKLLELVALCVSVAGCIVLVAFGGEHSILKSIFQGLFVPTYGFYMLIAGWICACVGLVTNI